MRNISRKGRFKESSWNVVVSPDVACISQAERCPIKLSNFVDSSDWEEALQALVSGKHWRG